MTTVTALRYSDRTEEQRARVTRRLIDDMPKDEIAMYIVQLEMRLEALGNREHFKDETRFEDETDE